MSCLGRNTYLFDQKVYILSGAAVVGPMEGEGPLGPCFDKVWPKIQTAAGSWEDTEVKMQKEAVDLALGKAALGNHMVDVLLGGDLINQLTITNFAAKEREIPFLGLYNACATMSEGLLLGASLIGGGFAAAAAVVASSHNATSERQYRFPTELGTQRSQTSQWTVTGAGAMVLAKQPSPLRIVSGTVGKIIDYGVKDPDEMGAAMAPAAADTILQHLKNSDRKAADYDLICTGDLGSHGHRLLTELLKKEHVAVEEQFQDGGMWIYHKDQDSHAGGSGCGCSASIWSSYLLDALAKGKYRRVLLVGTGALLSPLSVGQGHAIPAIAHGIEVIKEEAAVCG